MRPLLHAPRGIGLGRLRDTPLKDDQIVNLVRQRRRAHAANPCPGLRVRDGPDDFGADGARDLSKLAIRVARVVAA